MSKPLASRAAAIDAKCRECIYDPLSAGTWRQQVAACPSANCALHPFRPVPTNCQRNGSVDRVATSALSQRLDDLDRKEI